jgi:hypothetical protein
MATKNVYPVKMKSLLLYNDLMWSRVYILRNVETSMGGHLKLTLYDSPIFFHNFKAAFSREQLSGQLSLQPVVWSVSQFI